MKKSPGEEDKWAKFATDGAHLAPAKQPPHCILAVGGYVRRRLVLKIELDKGGDQREEFAASRTVMPPNNVRGAIRGGGVRRGARGGVRREALRDQRRADIV